MTKTICDERSGNEDLDGLGRLVVLLLLKIAVAGLCGDWLPYAPDMALDVQSTS